MNLKQVTITNARGDSINSNRHFSLSEDFQISGLGAIVNYSSTTIDGAHYQSTKLNVRDIDVPLYIRKNGKEQWQIEELRHEFNKVVNPKYNPMRIDFVTKAGQSFYLIANSESAPIFYTGRDNDNKKWLKGLLQFVATDPYIYESKMQRVEIAEWIGNLEFPLEVTEEGIEIGYRAPSLIVNAENRGSEATGILIEFRSIATVVNPSLINVDTYEQIKLNFTMLGGDKITISTYEGDRYIHLTRNNVTTSIFNSYAFDVSTFLQLHVGDNLIRYAAENGEEFLEVSLTFNNKRIGV